MRHFCESSKVLVHLEIFLCILHHLWKYFLRSVGKHCRHVWIRLLRLVLGTQSTILRHGEGAMPSTHSMLSSIRCSDQLTIPHHVAWPNSILHLHPQTVASVRAGLINSVCFEQSANHGVVLNRCSKPLTDTDNGDVPFPPAAATHEALRESQAVTSCPARSSACPTTRLCKPCS